MSIMTTEQLAELEDDLYADVMELYQKGLRDIDNESIQIIFSSYKQIHKQYSELAQEQNEALKRALFIQWYSITEPNYLTGIYDLEQEAMTKIIDIIEAKINDNSMDNELKWMLDYYATWDFVFSKYQTRVGLMKLIANRTDKLPEGLEIDREKMQYRGSMGKYFNSLNHFTNIDKNDFS